jgi:hypothetical protein
MKTAMQELLDITYRSISNAKELKSNGLNDQREIDIMLNVYNVYRVIIERDMLEKEKEQMIEMYYEGHTAPYFSQYGNDVVKQAEGCYNKNYNQNK